jgi:hypothetical protein
VATSKPVIMETMETIFIFIGFDKGADLVEVRSKNKVYTDMYLCSYISAIFIEYSE